MTPQTDRPLPDEIEYAIEEYGETVAQSHIFGGKLENAVFRARAALVDAIRAALPGTDKLSIEIYQHDWIPGFAAFLNNGNLEKNARPHVVLNLSDLLITVACGDVPPADLPYIVAECLMHEVMHVLEAWAKVEFSEERVEGLICKYREAMGKEAGEEEGHV